MIDNTRWETVETIALNYSSTNDKPVQDVTGAIQRFLSHNVLRISKARTLHPYNLMAEEVLRAEYRRISDCI